MIIQHNIMALNSYNKLSGNNSAVQKNLEKLSSGYRINRAGDDAAGLAISEKMRAQITGLERAKLNAQDGISLVQTGEGALTEVHSMLNRLVELGTESANGVYQADDRQRIQDEVDQTIAEIDRISEATNFNGIKLLDGSLGGGTSGGGLKGASIINYKAATGTAAYGDLSSTSTFSPGVETMSVNGMEVVVDWSKLSTADQNKLKKNWANASADEKKEAAALVQNTINKAVKEAGGTNGVKVVAGQTGFEITSELSGSSNSKIALTTNVASGVLTAMFGVTSAGVTATESLKTAGTNMNGSFMISLDGEDFEINVTGLAANATSGDIIAALNTGIQNALTNYDTAKGLTNADAMNAAANFGGPKIVAKMNAEGGIEFVNNSGKKLAFKDYEGKSFAESLGISSAGKSISNGLTLQVGDTADDFNKVTVSVDNMSASGLGLSGLTVTDQGISMESVDKVKSAINKVSENRGRLGALQNRLEHTINNLATTTENMTAAESRIRDTDMAKEMMNFTKNNVLVQAAQAMLSQANQQPQQVLQLLR